MSHSLRVSPFFKILRCVCRSNGCRGASNCNCAVYLPVKFVHKRNTSKNKIHSFLLLHCFLCFHVSSVWFSTFETDVHVSSTWQGLCSNSAMTLHTNIKSFRHVLIIIRSFEGSNDKNSLFSSFLNWDVLEMFVRNTLMRCPHEFRGQIVLF